MLQFDTSVTTFHLASPKEMIATSLKNVAAYLSVEKKISLAFFSTYFK